MYSFAACFGVDHSAVSEVAMQPFLDSGSISDGDTSFLFGIYIAVHGIAQIKTQDLAAVVRFNLAGLGLDGTGGHTIPLAALQSSRRFGLYVCRCWARHQRADTNAGWT